MVFNLINIQENARKIHKECDAKVYLSNWQKSKRFLRSTEYMYEIPLNIQMNDNIINLL